MFSGRSTHFLAKRHKERITPRNNSLEHHGRIFSNGSGFSRLPAKRGAPILDVRTPAEYDRAHLPDAHNLPLFTNEERVIVGTAYKQQGRKAAIMLGLDMVGVKCAHFRKPQSASMPHLHSLAPKTLLVHCWRGGMRATAWVSFWTWWGIKFSLRGGSQSVSAFSAGHHRKPREIGILGGKTGSGKTAICKALKRGANKYLTSKHWLITKALHSGHLAKNRHNAGKFENRIGTALWGDGCFTPRWIEDESRMVEGS